MDARQPLILPADAAGIAAAANEIARGGIVAVPTETVYGLAADATDATAVARIYAAKGRPSFNPLIVHVLDIAQADAIAQVDDVARQRADAFWPGPLTQVLPLRGDAEIASLVTAGLATVAIRVPAHPVMRALLVATGRPLAAPSANRSNHLSPTHAAHVAVSLGAAVPLVLDAGACAAGVESTIVSGNRILRPGPITAAMLGLPEFVASSGEITAPGQLAHHYAPTKALRLNARCADADEWLIGFGAVDGDDSLSHEGDLVAAAAGLFDALHRADASARARIAVAPIPDEGIGIAINDRLRRAATRWRNR